MQKRRANSVGQKRQIEGKEHQIKTRFYVSGKVQDVGCRGFIIAEMLAHGFREGAAFNLPDGRVEVRVKGNRENIDDFKVRLAKSLRENFDRSVMVRNSGQHIKELEVFPLMEGAQAHLLLQFKKATDVLGETRQEIKSGFEGIGGKLESLGGKVDAIPEKLTVVRQEIKSGFEGIGGKLEGIGGKLESLGGKVDAIPEKLTVVRQEIKSGFEKQTHLLCEIKSGLEGIGEKIDTLPKKLAVEFKKM